MLPFLLLICSVGGGAVIAFQYFQQKPSEEILVVRENVPVAAQPLPAASLSDGSQQQYNLTSHSPSSQNGSIAIDQGEQSGSISQSELPASQLAVQPEEQQAGTIDQPEAPGSSHQEPSESRAAIEAFYSHLDQQPYVRNFHFDSASNVYFSQLIQKMLDTPPVVSGETNDLFTILQNTAHFFRVVGRQNILAMKAIISHEHQSYEKILSDFYSISKQPDYLRESFSIDLKEDALYDYAGFFLTTMGGRLYLFRRDSSLRMIVSYYSILVVEEAVQSGRNRHGIDIRPAIDNLIGEIENSGNQLQLKEHYLDNLYDLKEKYL
ncbi:hypothetical protein [Desulfopila aestuarii]|nr:hypothetical protein [Desulfopila aestuarii]